MPPTPTLGTCCALLVYGRVGIAIINQGVGVGPGSAARNTSRTSRRESVQIGTFSAGQHCYCHPLYCQWTLFKPFRAPNLLESKCKLPDFFARQQYMLATPFHKVTVTLAVFLKLQEAPPMNGNCGWSILCMTLSQYMLPRDL